MTRTKAGIVTVVLVWALAATATGWAADNVLKALPEKTLAFLRINRLAETDAKLAALAEQAHWPLPSLLALFKAQSGVKEGLDEKGTAALVVVGEDVFEEPPVVLFVPVTDYDKFLASVKRGESKPGIARVQVWNSPFLVKRAGSFAVFAEPRHQEVLEKDLAPGGLDKQLAPLASYLEENDLSAAVTRHGIYLMARVVEQQNRQMREMIANAGDRAAGPAKILELYHRFFQAVDAQTVAVAAGLRVGKEGSLRFTGRVSLVASGSAAATLAKLEPSKEDPLAGLPGGPFVFAAGTGMPPQLAEAMLGPYGELVYACVGAFGMPPDQKEEYVKASSGLMQAARTQSVLFQPGKGEPAYRDVGVLMRVDSAKTFLADYEKQVKAYIQAIQGSLNKITMSMALRRTEIQGRPALEMNLQLPPVAMGEAQQVIDKLLGPGGKINIYMVAIDEHTVVTSYVGKELIGATVEALQQPKKRLSADPLVAKTRAMLPPDALALGYWSPSGTVAFVNRVLKIFAGLPGVPKSVPEFPATPPVGFAVRTLPAEIQADVVVPAEIVQSIMAYGLKFVAMFQGGM